MATGLKMWSFLARLKPYGLTPRGESAFDPKMTCFGWPKPAFLSDLSFNFIPLLGYNPADFSTIHLDWSKSIA
jgi:hypothetical protein